MNNANIGPIKAVIFDFDGTLTLPEALDFAAIKRKLGCPENEPVLEYILNIPDPVKQKEMLTELEIFETEGAARSVPAEGAEDILVALQIRKIPVAVLTRNSYRSVARALQNFNTIGPEDFAVIVTRDDALPIKPDPAGVLFIASQLNIPPANILVVGDYIFDMQAGRKAGCSTVMLDPDGTLSTDYREQDCTAANLFEVHEIIKMHIGLSAGKLPNNILAKLLENFDFSDPTVLINPGIGEDTAAIQIQGEEVLVLKSDPITFATDAIGQYAVLVNANDIATSGATPRWLLTTLLFPVGTTAAEISAVVADLVAVCHQWGITLCGGHTEITEAVTRPVVSGMLAGTVPRKGLIDKKAIAPGDHLFFTKSVSVEGTSILARELPEKLLSLGVTLKEIETAREMLSMISILPEALIAAGHKGITGMHDVTEGGLATAVRELGLACGCRIHIDMDRIPVFEVTQKICLKFHLDPMGLIGSGSLLICCKPESSMDLEEQIRSAGIKIAKIGVVMERGEGIRAQRNGKTVDWPDFEVDEIARLFASSGQPE